MELKEVCYKLDDLAYCDESSDDASSDVMKNDDVGSDATLGYVAIPRARRDGNTARQDSDRKTHVRYRPMINLNSTPPGSVFDTNINITRQALYKSNSDHQQSKSAAPYKNSAGSTSSSETSFTSKVSPSPYAPLKFTPTSTLLSRLRRHRLSDAVTAAEKTAQDACTSGNVTPDRPNTLLSTGGLTQDSSRLSPDGGRHAGNTSSSPGSGPVLAGLVALAADSALGCNTVRQGRSPSPNDNHSQAVAAEKLPFWKRVSQAAEQEDIGFCGTTSHKETAHVGLSDIGVDYLKLSRPLYRFSQLQWTTSKNRHSTAPACSPTDSETINMMPYSTQQELTTAAHNHHDHATVGGDGRSLTRHSGGKPTVLINASADIQPYSTNTGLTTTIRNQSVVLPTHSDTSNSITNCESGSKHSRKKKKVPTATLR